MEFLHIIDVECDLTKLSTHELDQLAFDEYSCLGKTEFDLNEEDVDKILGDKAYCGGDLPEDVLFELEQKLQDGQKQSYFWEDEKKAESFQKFLQDKGLQTEKRKIPKKDWNESWRQSFQTIPVTKDLSVVPSWEFKDDEAEKVFIYPGMGFGTGNHETTFLCLKFFSDLTETFQSGQSCLDFGCGSGILGIAAIKKKKMVVDFVDIDPNALDNCVENLKHNHFENYSQGHSLLLRDRFNPKEGGYSLVFANILESILLEESSVLKECLAPGGVLIVSGLLVGQEESIKKEYSELQLIGEESKGSWCALVFRKG